MDRYGDLRAIVNDLTIAQVRHKISVEYGHPLWCNSNRPNGTSLDEWHREQLVSLYAEEDAREG